MAALQIRAAYPRAAIITLVWPFEQQLAGVQGPYQVPIRKTRFAQGLMMCAVRACQHKSGSSLPRIFARLPSYTPSEKL